MKKFTKLAALFFAGIAATSFTACDDDEKVVDIDYETPLTAVTTQYVNNVVYPTYTNLAVHATTLYNACVNIQTKFNAGTLAQSDVDAACEAFKLAREQWELSEAWLYGAASDYEIDPHIDSWPLDQGQMAEFLSTPSMITGLHSDDPIAFVSENNSSFDTALGFHGLEFVLFRDGANRPVSAFSGNETHESFEGKTVSCAEEIAFLVAVSGDLRDHTYWLEVAWKGTAADATHQSRVSALGYKTKAQDNTGLYYGEDLLQAGTSASTHASRVASIASILDAGCSNICQEVYQQKLGQAYRCATGQGDAEDAPDYIESPYSHRSFIDYQDNIRSIRNTLYGSLDGTVNSNSILKFLENNNYSEASDLNTKLQAALSALDDCKTAPGYFVANPGHANVKKAIDAIQALDDALQAAKNWVEKL